MKYANIIFFYYIMAVHNSIVTGAPVEHDGLLFFAEQKCGRSTVSYSIIASSNGHIFRYEPNNIEVVEKCSEGCECSGEHHRNALMYTHIVEQQHKRSSYIFHCDKFVNVEDYIVYAHSIGFKTVIVNEHQNSLLKLISALELNGGYS
jgi:hypothetical protein